MNGVIKYPGSKWRIAKWIIQRFPKHHSYLEPFFGSGAVFFSKPRSNIETINDIDDNVVNLFRCIREDPEKLSRSAYLTPYARVVYEDACASEGKDPYQKAINFMIQLNSGYGFRTNDQKVGWKEDIQGREKGYAAIDWGNLPNKIIEAAERLKGVQIEHMDAVELIKKFNSENVLIYCDPPYMLSTRRQKQYAYEMENRDHEELLEALKAHKGSVMLSGYESDLYREALSNWHTEQTISRNQAGKEKIETIWMNFSPARQMTLQEWREEEGET